MIVAPGVAPLLVRVLGWVLDPAHALAVGGAGVAIGLAGPWSLRPLAALTGIVLGLSGPATLESVWPGVVAIPLDVQTAVAATLAGTLGAVAPGWGVFVCAGLAGLVVGPVAAPLVPGFVGAHAGAVTAALGAVGLLWGALLVDLWKQLLPAAVAALLVVVAAAPWIHARWPVTNHTWFPWILGVVLTAVWMGVARLHAPPRSGSSSVRAGVAAGAARGGRSNRTGT